MVICRLKSIFLELLYWLLGQVQGFLWLIIGVTYFVLLVLIITNFPAPYSYYAGAVGFIIGIILGVMYLPDISTWTLKKKQQLKEERDTLRK